MFQQPPARVSSRTWEQEGPVGGEDFDGEAAPVALAVSPQGIQTTRVVPTAEATANNVGVAALSAQRILGRTPQRRRVTLIGFTAGGTVGALIGRLAVDMGMAQANVGLALLHGVPIPITSADEIWAQAGAAAIDVSYWAEIDRG